MFIESSRERFIEDKHLFIISLITSNGSPMEVSIGKLVVTALGENELKSSVGSYEMIFNALLIFIKQRNYAKGETFEIWKQPLKSGCGQAIGWRFYRNIASMPKGDWCNVMHAIPLWAYISMDLKSFHCEGHFCFHSRPFSISLLLHIHLHLFCCASLNRASLIHQFRTALNSSTSSTFSLPIRWCFDWSSRIAGDDVGIVYCCRCFLTNRTLWAISHLIWLFLKNSANTKDFLIYVSCFSQFVCKIKRTREKGKCWDKGRRSLRLCCRL